MKNRKILFITLLSFLMTGHSVPLQLADEPLFLNQSVPPALAITFDDSGSMARGYMPDASVQTYDTAKPSTASFDYNLISYNPAIQYKPPVRADGSSFPDSDFSNAKHDGYYLTGDLTPKIDLGSKYRFVWSSRADYGDGTVNVGYRDAGRVIGGDDDGEAYYYTWNGPATASLDTRKDGPKGSGDNEYTYHKIMPADETNFANWYTYYNTRGKLARAAMSHAFVNFGPDFKIDWQQLNHNKFPYSGGTNMKLFTGQHRKDFYEWLYSIPADGFTPLRASYRRAGRLFRKSGIAGPYYDVNYGGELSCQQNFHIAISDGTWNDDAGIPADEDNTSKSLPALENGLVYEYDTDTLPSKMYVLDEAATLADNAFRFWSRDLRTDLPNQVPTFIDDFTNKDGTTEIVTSAQKWWENPELFWNPNNDPASWQHMVNFNIGLGIEGKFDQDTDLILLRNGTKEWNKTNTAGGLVDDVWHASINSRGKYFSARDPLELASALNKVVSNIIKRKGRASAGSISSNVVSDETLAFKTGYDTADWTGFLVASELNLDGSFGDVIWDAACKLTGGFCTTTSTIVAATTTPTSRKIFTYKDGAQVDFFASSFNTAMNTSFKNSTFVTNLDSSGFSYNISDIVNYIRGERSQEQANGGFLRNRRSLLGDIIHSPAKIVRGPGSGYVDEIWQAGTVERIAADADNGYGKFREDNKFRDNVILTGANDGMLHAFAAGIINPANGGDEHWAYIPSQALEGLSGIADPAYKHRSFVDAAPFVKDAFINGGWKTVALGNMRHGGKMFYALDLGSDPVAEPSVLWEFTDADDADLGYTYAGGIITRVFNPSNGDSKWVVFLPNGYNSSNQQSAMYALDLETGVVLHKWTTGLGSIASPNGMGPPVATDFVAYDGASPGVTFYGADQATDFVYAGDLHGNLYKFDATDVFTPGITPAVILFNGSTNQPITTPPRVFTPNNANADVMITFGTGKYLEPSDRGVLSTPPQYIIGIRDTKDVTSVYSLNDSRLVDQTISESGGFRSVTTNPTDPTESWKIALPIAGERMVNVMGRDNQSKVLTVITIIPNGIDPCLPGGQSWIMAINAISGGAPSSNSYFNGGNSDGVLVNDIVLGANTITTPGGNNTTINIDIEGGTDTTLQIDIPTKRWGRKSWHRIILE